MLGSSHPRKQVAGPARSKRLVGRPRLPTKRGGLEPWRYLDLASRLDDNVIAGGPDLVVEQ